jgi:DNA-binding CsgD family transcriptional regulator
VASVESSGLTRKVLSSGTGQSNGPGTTRLLRLTLWPAGAIWIAYVGGVVAQTGNPWYYTSAVLGVAAAFMGLGLLTWARRPANLVGPLLVAIGFAWLVPLLRYSPDSIPWTLALVLPTLHQALLVHLAFAYPSGRLSSRFERGLVALVYLVATLGPLAVAMTQRDPGFLGVEGLPRNLVLVSTDVELWRTTRALLSFLQGGLAILIVVAVIRRTVIATLPARRASAPLLFGGTVAALLFTTGYDVLGYASTILPAAAQDWRGFGRWLVVAAYALVPFAFSLGLLRARLAHSAVADLVADLGTAPSASELAAGLVRAVGDPSLTLVIWSDVEVRYIGLEGRPVELPAEGSERAVTLLEQDGRHVGALIHDPALLADPSLMDAAAAVARLALERERLSSELRVQLAEVEASRVRIVDAGTAVRSVGFRDTTQDREGSGPPVARSRERAPVEELTAREREILALMAEGRSNQAIAATLFLGIKTIESHISSIFGKLDLERAPEDHRRVLAVLTYLRSGESRPTQPPEHPGSRRMIST